MINQLQLRQYVIRPVLKAMNAYSLAAEELLIMTAAHESRMGYFLHQVSGPALGIYQMEPDTADDIWLNYLEYKPLLAAIVGQWGGNHEDLIGNLFYATAMARTHYLRDDDALPDSSDIRGLAAYYKRVYNTVAGKATIDQAVSHYNEFVDLPLPFSPRESNSETQ